MSWASVEQLICTEMKVLGSAVLAEGSPMLNESLYGREPNTFNGESSDDQRDTGSEALSFDNASSEDGEVKVVDERVNVVSSFDRGKLKQLIPTTADIQKVEPVKKKKWRMLKDVRDLEEASPNGGQGQEAAAATDGLFGSEGHGSRDVRG
ncbi:hypothetical protein L3X38_008402 [Prunus dulcis]|uniref:Uncharacterized protein n=1 Tax=Prunus dulcis TaxID=3755 RepID=A0AAD4ZWE1_PRUDU|nr:hypothetical protein L3X38_008402 [Prunus dulcis]